MEVLVLKKRWAVHPGQISHPLVEKFPPWFSPHLRCLINSNIRLYRRDNRTHFLTIGKYTVQCETVRTINAIKAAKATFVKKQAAQLASPKLGAPIWLIVAMRLSGFDSRDGESQIPPLRSNNVEVANRQE